MIYKIISIITLLLIGNTCISQDKFSQFIVENLETREQAVQLDTEIRLVDGVIISRTDINSKKYLCIYSENSNLDEETISNWFISKGFQIKCYREGFHGIDKILDQKLDCE